MSVCIIAPVSLLPVPEYGLIWCLRAWARPHGIAGDAGARIEQLFHDLCAPAGAPAFRNLLRALRHAAGRPLLIGQMGDQALQPEEAALLDAIAWQALRRVTRAGESLGLVVPPDRVPAVLPYLDTLVRTLEAAGLTLARLPPALRRSPDPSTGPTWSHAGNAARGAGATTIHLPRRVAPA